MIQRYSRALNNSSLSTTSAALPHCSFSNVGKAVEDCMRAVIGVLLNLTHDNGILHCQFMLCIIALATDLTWSGRECLKRLIMRLFCSAEWGSTKTGEQEQLIVTALNCVLRVPRYIPQEQRFDVRVLVRCSSRQEKQLSRQTACEFLCLICVLCSAGSGSTN